MVFLAFSPNSLALFLLSSPSSPPSITFFTTFLTSSPFTNASSLISSTKKIGTFAPTATPILKTSTTNLSFTNWSPNLGHVAITTPDAIASNVEFHPQCVINPPTATWPRIIACGAHPLITIPLPIVLSSNSDNQFSTSSLLSASFTTQINDNCEDDADSSPCPICTSWEMGLHDKLPKLTNMTELGALESSQLNNNSVSMEEAFPLMALLSKSLLTSDNGPMGHTLILNKKEYVFLLERCRSINSLKQIHGQVLISGLDQSRDIIDDLLVFLTEPLSGDIHYAFKLFDSLRNPYLFAFNLMIEALTKKGRHKNSILLFSRMREENSSPDNFTYPFIRKAFGCLRLDSEGRKTHGLVSKSGFEFNPFVRNSLMDMYAELGDIKTARILFDEISQTDVVTWNVLIASYVKCGEFEMQEPIFYEYCILTVAKNSP